MALELTGIEISADVATAISAISAYIGWQAGRNKEKREAEEKQKKHDMEIIINRLKPFVVLVRDFDFTDPNPELIPKIQNAFFEFQSESISFSSDVFEFVTNANFDFNYVLKNDQTSRGVIFILYSLINLIFELYSFMQGEDRAKKYLRSVLQTDNNIDEIIKSYKEYRKNENIS